MCRGFPAHSPSSPPARRSGSRRPRNARSRPEPPFDSSPVLPEALLPPGEPTRSVGLPGVTYPPAGCAAAPRRALLVRGRCARGTCRPGPRSAAPRLRLPARSGPFCLRSFFSLSPPLLLLLSSSFSSSRLLFYLVFSFSKSGPKALQVGEGSPGELFPCLVVAVVAAARRAASHLPRSSSSRGGERAVMLRPPAGDPSPPALRMPSCPVAQVPGWRYARLRGSPGAFCA